MLMIAEGSRKHMLKTTYLSRTVVVATTMIVLLSQTVLTQPLFAFTAAPTAVQSPNTATMIVTVVDQTGAVVKDARVSVVNIATGAERDAISGEGGSATFAALSVNGEYKVRVAMSGFTSEDVNGLTLRAGETATVKVKLVAGGGKREVTVYGTTEGVRADPQIGLPLGSKQIDETPILGRK